jgi:hypothetical protein
LRLLGAEHLETFREGHLWNECGHSRTAAYDPKRTLRISASKGASRGDSLGFGMDLQFNVAAEKFARKPRNSIPRFAIGKEISKNILARAF